MCGCECGHKGSVTQHVEMWMCHSASLLDADNVTQLKVTLHDKDCDKILMWACIWFGVGSTWGHGLTSDWSYCHCQSSDSSHGPLPSSLQQRWDTQTGWCKKRERPHNPVTVLNTHMRGLTHTHTHNIRLWMKNGLAVSHNRMNYGFETANFMPASCLADWLFGTYWLNKGLTGFWLDPN